MRILLALILAAALAGCGFHLRGSGSSTLPYKTMHIALPETAEVRVWLERHIAGSGSTRIVDDPTQADAVFQQLGDERQKSVLSVSNKGRVKEYRLQMTYQFRLVNGKGQELVPSTEVSLSRDISFNDDQILSKNIEEGLLWRDMNSDLVNQIMRRLTIIKPKNPDEATD